ncbi:MAG TPA: type II toxin-antitoxin system VapC family toxin [Fimbriimonas sp.]|nr:type II toxin-antitoxin system VapC family toxin [Fimbriimonas sp.]
MVADTDVLINHLRGVRQVVELIAELSEADRLRTTTVNLFELLSGADDGKRGDPVRALSEALDAISLDRKAAAVAAGIQRDLDSKGQTIGMGDSLIAGICLAHGCQLLTLNRKHFARVPGLELIDVGTS